MRTFDLAVVGAGPAGMAAAVTAAKHGLTVALLDEQQRPGGQIYRDVDKASPERTEVLGRDYTHGRSLTTALRSASVDHIHGAVVWAIEDGFRISFTRDAAASQIAAEKVLLATGALERPMPIPGWTLPGVMTAGAGQILLKQSGMIPENAILVGSGPLLYLLAAQMVRAGVPPLALVETQSWSDLKTASRNLFGALKGWRYLAKGLGLLSEILKARIPRYTGATDIAIEGTTNAEAVAFTAQGKRIMLPCEAALLHHGVVPNTQAARSLGARHLWNARQHCFSPELDGWGASSVQNLFIAGDNAGIGGAKAAEIAGQLAALKIAAECGKMAQDELERTAAPLKRARESELAARPFIDTAYPPYRASLLPADETIVCRCEEVTAGDIRRYAKLGCLGPNQAKAFGRPGMGPCQGRYCGLTVTTLLADANGTTPDETGHYRIRPPLKPVTLGELAAMGTD